MDFEGGTFLGVWSFCHDRKISIRPSALPPAPRPPEGTAPTELGPLADALWTGLAGITQALFPCSPWLLANPPANT